jgi:hypothetical protein
VASAQVGANLPIRYHKCILGIVTLGIVESIMDCPESWHPVSISVRPAESRRAQYRKGSPVDQVEAFIVMNPENSKINHILKPEKYFKLYNRL